MSNIALALEILKCLVLALRADWSSENIRSAAPHLQHLLVKKQNEKKSIKIRVFL